MANLYHEDSEQLVSDLIDKAIVAGSHAIQILGALQLLYTARSRCCRETIDDAHEPLRTSGVNVANAFAARGATRWYSAMPFLWRGSGLEVGPGDSAFAPGFSNRLLRILKIDSIFKCFE